MTKHTKRIIVIVPKGQAVSANTKAKEVDTVGGEFTWTVELSSSGNPPATHYWCNWQMKPKELTQLEELLSPTAMGETQIFKLNHYDPAIASPTPQEVLKLSKPPLKTID